MKLLKPNNFPEKKGWTDEDWLQEFYKFLQGNLPDTIRMGKGHKPILTPKKAFSIIWYLQEHLPIFKDTIEQCSNCNELFNSDNSGYYSEKKGKHYCDCCLPKEYYK